MPKPTVLSTLHASTVMVIMDIIVNATPRQNDHLNTFLAQNNAYIVGHDAERERLLVEYPDDDFPTETGRMFICMDPGCDCANH